ncbi:hypothetical protein L1049_013124 [Liquidambar formosana]|uniref:Uncharacterized protein n=1 Tax=Liquidambar formosana TaxID=63359 RepID=A0AAP0WXY7_LIQFO
MATPVSKTKTISVYPKTMHPPKLLNLSNLDRQCPILMYLVFFYKPSPACMNLSVNSVFGSLKAGLEETLSVWYPAAGRLSLNNTNDGKLNLWCNNDGAILVEAVTQVKISELGDLSQYNEFFENLVFRPVFNGTFSDMPLVVAQVTRFGCGGYSLGIGTSHSLFDGPATFNFLCAWASNATMKGNSGLEQHKPVHERGTLLIDQIYGADGKLGGCKLSEVGSSNQENFVLRTFHLSGAMIESLKRKLFGEKRGSFSCSSFEVVAAHLWKARTKALGLRKERMVCLQFAVDTRNKMVPLLPKGFSGNAYVLASVALTAGELEEESHEALIEKIKEAKNSVTNEYVKAYIEALEAPQGTLPPLKELTLVSDWTRMPFHKVDFLHGEAAYASPLLPPIPQVAYFMQNPTESRRH